MLDDLFVGEKLRDGSSKNEGRALRKDIPDPSLVFLQLGVRSVAY